MMVLFVCRANASRSQMAEGWFNHLVDADDNMYGFSAGVIPCGKVSSLGIKVMDEIGIDISEHYSKSVEDLGDVAFDYIVTLSNDAKELLPELVGNPVLMHIPVNDPFDVIGTTEQMLNAYRVGRDEIKTLVESLIGHLRAIK